jgi:predicted kinase
MKQLILLRGLPGSGKSTFARSISPANVGHIEADMFFMKDGEYKFDASRLKDAHNWCHDVVETWMGPQGYEKIVVSNTFTTEWEMEPYYKLAEQYGYRVTSLVVENRHGSKSVHNVPEETLDKMKKRFEIKL